MTQYTIAQSPSIELQARNIEHGTWVRVAWLDSEPTVGLVLDYTGGSKRDGNYRSDFKGDRSLNVYFPHAVEARKALASVVHTQVIEILGSVQAPE